MGALAILEKDVIQANPLIRAKKEMNITEMRLFVLGLQDVKPHIKDDHVHDVEFPETKISYSELMDLFGTESNGNVTNLKKQVERAYDDKIELAYADGGFGFRHIYKKMDYKPQEGLTIQFDDEMKPYILELVNQAYTKYKVKAFFSLSSTYAWRLLESLLEKQGYLKQGKKAIYLEMSIEEVRFRLNVPDGKYKGRINNFKHCILDLPIKEINEKTDYHVWYEVKKSGRKVTGFKFWMKYKNKAAIENKSNALPPAQPEEKPAEPAPEDKKSILKDQMMNGEKFTLIQFNSIIKKWGVDVVAKNFALGVQEADARNLVGRARKRYIKSYVENDYAGDREQMQAVKDREAALAAEKKRKQDEMSEAFAAQGISLTGKPKKPKKKDRELTEDELDNLLSIVAYELKHDGLSNAVIKMIEACGFRDDREFILKYADRLRKY